MYLDIAVSHNILTDNASSFNYVYNFCSTSENFFYQSHRKITHLLLIDALVRLDCIKKEICTWFIRSQI